jgi:hypothetical protein
VDLKENLASGSQAGDSAAKSKSPMSPKENILHQAPPLAFGSRASTAKKQTLLHRLGPPDTTPGRVTKTRKDKPSASTQLPKPVASKVKVEKAETTKVLKQGPKRLRISGGAAVKQEVQLEHSFQVLATKPDTLWDNQAAATSSSGRPGSVLPKKQPATKTKAMHLSPIRKGALTRKKSFEWEKKKSKMLIKNKKQLTISSEESLENAPLPDAF